jgi:membrane protease YdiL (CAAX protease family)
VIFAPLSEEILFRGVLFGALLRRLSTNHAALISAIVFSVWHAYGFAGSLAVGFGGYLWAQLYARTGSLLPGMLVHAVLNAIVCLDALGSRV